MPTFQKRPCAFHFLTYRKKSPKMFELENDIIHFLNFRNEETKL